MRKVDIHYTLLLDFYGALLPKKQFEIADLYYNDDLSLSEIAQEQGITRQGVRDMLERAEGKLDEYEKALGLLEKDRLLKEATATIKKNAEILKSGIDEKLLNEIVSVCDNLSLKG